MVIAIREGSDIPIYQQIRDQIVQGISDGRLQTGEQLPTVRALAEEIGINSMTVNKAYQLLKQQGYIIADRRNGARVSKSFAKAPQLSFESRELLLRIIAEAKVGGMTQEEFLDECRKCYESGTRTGKEKNAGHAGGNENHADSSGRQKCKEQEIRADETLEGREAYVT